MKGPEKVCHVENLPDRRFAKSREFINGICYSEFKGPDIQFIISRNSLHRGLLYWDATVYRTIYSAQPQHSI